MIRCRDGAYYVGLSQVDLETRVAEHNAGKYDGWTKSRRPVKLIWSERFQFVSDAIVVERKLKGWTRAKKEALIRGEFRHYSRTGEVPKRDGIEGGSPAHG
jgi:putative endonuclease